MRIAAVLTLLIALSGLSGALTGLLLFAVLVTFEGGAAPLDALAAYVGAARLGALVGVLTGPAIAMIFLRRVPLWRATIETAGAAGLGAALGGLVPLPFAWAGFALLFALLAAFRLNRSYKLKPQAPAAAAEETRAR